MIKGTKTKEAIEILFVFYLMAGKVFALPVLEKSARILLHDKPQKQKSPGPTPRG
jgi:hypothetical protein